MMLLLFCIGSVLVPMVIGYPSGPPASKCDNMTPKHESASTQESDPPYQIRIISGQTTYSDNEQIEAVLEGKNGETFVGFIVQARVTVGTYTTYGSITSDSPQTGNACAGNGANKNAALTHTSRDVRTSVAFRWTAPANNVGSITFVITVVQSKLIFWAQKSSVVLTYKPTTGSPSDTTTSPTTKKATDEQNPVSSTKTTFQTRKKVTDTVTSTVTTAMSSDQQSPVSSTETTIQTTKKVTDTVTSTVTTAMSSDQQSPVSSTETTIQTRKKVTDTVTSTVTTAVSSDQINRDPECEMTKSCFPDSTKCSTNCDFLISWKASGEEDVEFTLQRKTSSNNYWIGIGLSQDPRMGNDSVMECVSNNGAVDVKISFNQPNKYSNIRPENNDQFGVSLVDGNYTNGILSCTFRRKINASLAGVSPGSEEESWFFDLNQEWHLLVAHSSANQGNKVPHSTMPDISPNKIDFLIVNTEVATTTAMTDTGEIKKDSKCGDTRGCFHDCGGDGSCNFLLTWVDNRDDIDFTFTCKRPGGSVYCAVGLSKDKEMGDDSVFECVSSGGQVSLYTSYNDGRVNKRLSQEKFGITNLVASHENGILQCKFSRKKTAALAGGNSTRKRRAADADASTYFDMNDDFNLLYAYGSAISGFINKHQVRPKVSSEKGDFQSFMDIGAKTVANTLVKVHGILMMCAWLFFARLGIFVAGQYKTVWPEGMEWCGQKRWFILHRSVMVTAFMLTATGFVIIFVHVGGYSKIVNNSFAKSHPIIGIVTMCLATLNPIMALFRPHPNTPKRPYFNFAHISVGITAYVCSVVNVFSGFEQTSANVPFSAKIVVWTYLGWVGLIETLSYIYDCKNRKASKGEAYELKSSGGIDSEGSSQRVSTFKVALLCLHAVTMMGLVIAVSVIVWKGGADDDDD